MLKPFYLDQQYFAPLHKAYWFGNRPLCGMCVKPPFSLVAMFVRTFLRTNAEAIQNRPALNRETQSLFHFQGPHLEVQKYTHQAIRR